jgi:hypothetical protein
MLLRERLRTSMHVIASCLEISKYAASRHASNVQAPSIRGLNGSLYKAGFRHFRITRSRTTALFVLVPTRDQGLMLSHGIFSESQVFRQKWLLQSPNSKDGHACPKNLLSPRVAPANAKDIPTIRAYTEGRRKPGPLEKIGSLKVRSFPDD